MDNILNPSDNKTQALIKLQIAKENLEGADQALSGYHKPRIETAIVMVDKAIETLINEMKQGFK